MNTPYRPKQINLAVNLIISTFVIGLPKAYVDRAFLSTLGSPKFMALVLLFTIFILAFLTYKMWLGKNWARITFAVMLFIGIYPSIKGIPTEAQRSVFVAVCTGWQAIGQLIATVIMFLPSSNAWFKQTNGQQNA